VLVARKTVSDQGEDNGRRKTPEELAAEAQAATDANNAEWQGKLDAIMADNDRLNAKISESNKHTKAAEAKAAKEEKERLKGATTMSNYTKDSETEREGLMQQMQTVI